MEFADEHRDLDAVRDQSRMLALICYRMLQKGYSSIMSEVMNEEAAERQRVKEVVAAAAAASAALQAVSAVVSMPEKATSLAHEKAAPLYLGVFCRDLVVVGSLLSQARFNRPIPVKYEALSS